MDRHADRSSDTRVDNRKIKSRAAIVNSTTEAPPPLKIPLHNEPGNATFLRDVATPKDSSFIQTNVVRVNGRRQVYIPVFRQLGASTLRVIDTIRGSLDYMKARLSRTDRPPSKS